MCHTRTERERRGESVLHKLIFVFAFVPFLLSNVVCLHCLLLFSFIHSRHTYRLLCWVLFFAFFAFRDERNEVVFARTGILIHFCPISRIHWRTALMCPFFILLWHSFFFFWWIAATICANEYWKRPNTMLIDQLKIWLWYWVDVTVHTHRASTRNWWNAFAEKFHLSIWMTNFRFSKLTELNAHLKLNQYVVLCYDFICDWMQNQTQIWLEKLKTNGWEIQLLHC